MADDLITQMVNDPDFGKLSPAEQKKALAAHDPVFGKVADEEISKFVMAHQVTKATTVLSPEEQAQSRTLSNMTSAMSGQPMASPEDQARAEIGKQAGFGAAAATAGSVLAPVPAAGATGLGGTALRTLLSGAGAAPGVAVGQQNPTPGSVAGESALYAAPQPIAEGGAWLGEKLAPMASQSLARILRLTPKSFEFGREPSGEVLERGLSSGNLKTMVEHIGEASKDVTSQLNATLKAAPGTVNVFDVASEVSKSIPNQAAANRFEQVVLDSVDKLGLKNLDKLTNTETNALKQEVARQARFVEGDLRPSIANAEKVFGGKLKDKMIANAPDAESLFESSANLTEASKRGAYAVRAEKSGQGRSALSAVDIKRPATYPRAATDTITGARTLFKMANALKESVPVSTALRIAFSLVYPGAREEQ